MVLEELVKKVNRNFRELLDTGTRTKENPTILAILSNLVELTTIADHADGTAPTDDAPALALVEAIAEPEPEPAPVSSTGNFSQQYDEAQRREREFEAQHPPSL